MLRTLKHLKLNIIIMVFAVFVIGTQNAHSQTVKQESANNGIGLSDILDVTHNALMPTVSPEQAKQIQCLARNVYFEAGSEPEKGMAAVARVVMNRVEHGFAKTPCEVIYQVNTVTKQVQRKPGIWSDIKVRVCQFSWVCEGVRAPKRENERYRLAQQIAQDVYLHDEYDDVVPDNTLFFHATHVKPGWKLNKVGRIGNHVFYSKGTNPRQRSDQGI